jgi:RNA polymerase sigma-70 factor (ECF subfamily)
LRRSHDDPDVTVHARSRDDDLSTSMRLLVRANAGQTTAVERLFARLLPDLRRWAHGRLPSWARMRMDTDDLVQEAFGALHRRMKLFDPDRKHAIQAYLRQTIRNRVRDEVRRAGKVEVKGQADLDFESPQALPLDRVIATEDRRRYVEALGRLRPADRELIVGRIELGFSYDQLAVAMEKPTRDAARVAVRRAVLRLAKEMDRD